MPIKTSGPISIQDIIDEFGGTGSLSDYYRGGDYVPNKNANSAIPVAGSGLPISLGDFYGATKIITLTFKAYGGGGAGGSGFENNSDIVSRAGTGGPTGLMLMSTFDERIDVNGGVVPDVIARDYFIQGAFDLKRDGVIFSPSAAGTFGGLGGLNNAFSDANATAGEGSEFGAGGAAGARNSAGGSAPWGHWGAAGGGGGGDQGNGDSYEFFGLINRGGADEWGKAGAGGEHEGRWEGKLDIDVEVDYVVQVGKGGTPAFDVGNHDGGYGNPGYMEFTVDSAANELFQFAPSGGGSNADRNKSYYFGFRVNRNGTVTRFPVPTSGVV